MEPLQKNKRLSRPNIERWLLVKVPPKPPQSTITVCSYTPVNLPTYYNGHQLAAWTMMDA